MRWSVRQTIQYLKLPGVHIWPWYLHSELHSRYILANLGGVPCARPQGSRFFCLDIQNFWNVTVSGVNAPLWGRPPPTGNPGSDTVSYLCTRHIVHFSQYFSAKIHQRFFWPAKTYLWYSLWSMFSGHERSQNVTFHCQMALKIHKRARNNEIQSIIQQNIDFTLKFYFTYDNLSFIIPPKGISTSTMTKDLTFRRSRLLTNTSFFHNLPRHAFSWIRTYEVVW